MQKVFDFDGNPQGNMWDGMWTTRTMEQELEACNMESPPRELFLSYLPKGGRIVDAGCGFGKWVIYLKRRGYDIVGIDSNELAIAKLKEFDESLKVELGDILNVNCTDNSFDAYISMGVIEHLEDGPTPALKEAYRLLKPNGLIFVSVPTVNVIRKLVRQPFRNAINAFPKALKRLRSGWGESKRSALLAAVGSIVPEKAKSRLPGRMPRYHNFMEYWYSKSELEDFLKQSCFEIIETLPHDFYDSRNHAVGLVVDFPFLRGGDGDNFELNSIGKLISRTLDRISPWIACSNVLCVGRSLKK